AEPLARDLGVDAGGEQMRGMAVPQVVQPDARQLDGAVDRLPPGLRQARRLQRRAVLARVDERVVGLLEAKPQELLGLALAVGTQLVDHGGGKRDGAAAAGFGRLVADAGFGLFGTLADR